MFGGQQAVEILCSIVRTKLVALWIGPAGVGLFGILSSGMDLIASVTQLNLRDTAVREIAASPREDIGRIGQAVRRLALWLGIAGALLTLLLSPWLSAISFGNRDMWWAFAWLSLAVLLMSVNRSEAAIFQGLKQFRTLTRCSILGSLGGLAVSVPMFWFWRIDSVVPSLIAYAVVTWLALGYYRAKLPAAGPAQGWRSTLKTGRKVLMLGFYMTVSAVVLHLVSYVFMAYLNHEGGLKVAGFYNAGFSLVNRYGGLVFAVIGMEFFPRLAGVVHSARTTKMFVANQIYLSLLILVPFATVMIACLTLVVRLFYTQEFLVTVAMVAPAMVGTVMRAISWCMAFVIVAKADGRTFIVTETVSAAIALALNVAGYSYGGYLGLGIAYAAWYAIYTAMIAAVYYRRYGLSLPRRTWALAAYAVGLTTLAAALAIAFTPLAAGPCALVGVVVSGWLLRKNLR